jgi:FAD:protein FMN transferase
VRALILALAGAVLLAACGTSEPVRQEGYVFGTRIEIAIAPGKVEVGRKAVAEVLQEFDRLHRTYHAWQKSELTALNDSLAAGKPHKASNELADLVTDARRIAASGDHLFDPGIGRLIEIWGFHVDEIKPKLPEDAALDTLMRDRPSIASVVVDENTVSSPQRSVALDFGGYLKGVALDRAVAIMQRHGIRHALINIGGNIYALGNREGLPGGRAWRIGIQHPRAAKVGNAPLATLELRDGEAIGTSGDYHRYFEYQGQRYCHLIDPRTGRPHAGTQSVTVLIAPGSDVGMRSDALSKPIFIAGNNWRAMADKLGVEAVLKIDGDGTALVTPAMKARLSIEVADLRVELR